MKIEYRPIQLPTDLDFLRKLYISTRWEEVAVLLDWTEQQKLNFLSEQFGFQHAHYMEQYRDADFMVIMQRETQIGRLYKDYRSDEIRIIDIALLPEYRGKGIGSQIMQGVLAEAKKKDLAVRIHVERNNPAMKLYDGLGFKKIGDTGVYYFMEWSSTG
ncbi:MAG TPA: GNAT family N-acetyltransferase [Saprospiraceae bacterium]|nr:GNAT family N-acetyltransferase [Saprospiraceae bacterium]